MLYIQVLLLISYIQMSLKVLCFGENQFLKRVIAKLRTDSRQNIEQQIVVDNVEVKGKPYLTFSISNPQLIGSQATGTSGLLYFLDPSAPLYEQKQFFFNIINQRKQFESIPAVIVYDKDQNLSIKEIVNQFELFKVKDRASMIKEVDLGDKQTIGEIFSWIDNQIQFRKTRSFDAPPKIVKMKAKYRQSEPQSTQKKYQSIIKQKKFKGIGVKNQQQAYIQMEKQRIKNENMEKQLANFNRNKKKMAPYDIKATPNPKIDANLHFFLKDARVEKAQEVNIKIQTDQFKQKPREKPYIPKKTGVNIATQIQSTQLFDFMKQVQPILDILTTRALQTAALQIQQQQEILKISKYKNAYNDKVKKQKKHEQQNIQQQLQAIKQKQRILEMARKKDQAKKLTTKKQTYYSIANTFLQNIYKDAAFSLYKKNLYPNQFEHALKTDYLPQILKRSLISYENLLQKQQCLQNVFEENCINPLQKQGKQLKDMNKRKKGQKQQRRINKGNAKRFIHVYYDSPEDKKFTSFSKYLTNEIQGNLQQYLKSREDEIQQAEDKHQSAQIDENEVSRIKQKDNFNFSSNHNSIVINPDRLLCFSTSQNKYEKPSDILKFTPGCLIFDKEGNLLHNITVNGKGQQFARGVTDLRFPRDLINFDTGIVINLAKVPQNTKSIICYVKVNNSGSYAGEAQVKKIKNSIIGIQFYKYAIPIFKQQIGSTIKWEQLIKAQEANPDGEDAKVKQAECLFVFGYHLVKKVKQGWVIQEINVPSKQIKDQQSGEFIEKIGEFYKRSQQIFKTQEEEPKPAMSKQQSRNAKRKSKKNIVQQKQAPKVQTKILSRILKEIQINLNSNWQQIITKLGGSVIEWKEFIQNSPDGWYLQFRGKKLENIEQIKKYNKVGDIILKKVIPVVEQEKPVIAEVEGEQKQEDD